MQKKKAMSMKEQERYMEDFGAKKGEGEII